MHTYKVKFKAQIQCEDKLYGHTYIAKHSIMMVYDFKTEGLQVTNKKNNDIMRMCHLSLTVFTVTISCKFQSWKAA